MEMPMINSALPTRRLHAQARSGACLDNVGFVLRGQDYDWKCFVYEGVWAVLHLAGRVAFGVDVGNFLHLERAFEGDGVVDAASEKEKIADVGIDASQLFALTVHGAEDFFYFSWEQR